MDAALPTPASIDRRTLAALVLAGAAGAALAEAGVPALAEGGNPMTHIESLGRLTVNLAHAYDEAGPARIAQYARNLELQATTLLTGGRLSESASRDAKVIHAQLLTMHATAAGQLGDFEGRARSAKRAAAVAADAGDPETEGHAWTLVALAQSNTGRLRGALSSVKKANVAKNSPAGVGAWLDMADIAATMGNRRAVSDAVANAERAHGKLTPTQWGNTPGYAMGTYHPARLKARAGLALADVGLYAEAAPRLDEAIDLIIQLDGGDGYLIDFAWLGQAAVLLGRGEVDGAREKIEATVAHGEFRPSALVAKRVQALDERSRGQFVDLVDQTRRWRLATA